MKVTSYVQGSLAFKLGVERQGSALNLNVWALWRSIVVHLVACGFSFHISLFPTIATGTSRPAQGSARDLEKLAWLTQAQTETFTSLILCMWLFNMFIFTTVYRILAFSIDIQLLMSLYQWPKNKKK